EPRISVMAPRGRPLAMPSTSAIPVDITSAAEFSRSLKAEPKRCASSDRISAFENEGFKAQSSFLLYRKFFNNFRKLYFHQFANCCQGNILIPGRGLDKPCLKKNPRPKILFPNSSAYRCFKRPRLTARPAICGRMPPRLFLVKAGAAQKSC